MASVRNQLDGRQSRHALSKRLAALASVLQQGQWRWPGPAMHRLRRLVTVLQASARDNDALLPQALRALDDLQQGDRESAADVCFLLLHYRGDMLKRIAREEALVSRCSALVLLPTAIPQEPNARTHTMRVPIAQQAASAAH